jgi:ribokinase
MIPGRFDIVTIGDITTDAFIRLKDASIHCKLDRDRCEICLPFKEKIPFEYVKVVHGTGNAANIVVAGSRLGLKTAIVTNIGDDENGNFCLSSLHKEKINTKYIHKYKGKMTNYHFVLWYEDDRTILTNHIEYENRKLQIPNTKWIYLTSFSGDVDRYTEEIIDCIKANPETKLAFQPGTFQIESGSNKFKVLLEHTDFISMNKGEAMKFLRAEKEDIKYLLSKIHDLGPNLVAITDAQKGSYLYDGESYYHILPYPDPKPAIERTGCGDAWTSTFISMLIMGKTPIEAFTYAPINPMSVAQYAGAQEGLLNMKDMEWWLNRAPEEYKVREI